MLFRVVTPVSSVLQVLKDLGPEQHGWGLLHIFKRFCDPESREVIPLQTSQEKWEKILVETQATPAKIDRLAHAEYPYYDKDVIWLSSLDPDEIFLSNAEFDLFICEV